MYPDTVNVCLNDGRVFPCPRLLTGQELTTLLNVPSVTLSRVASLGNGHFLNISQLVRSDNTLHHLSHYNELLLTNPERFSHIEQLYGKPL
jgi:hypothetical protein